jgi:hypothetical protein
MKAATGTQQAPLREAERSPHIDKRTTATDALEGRERNLKLFIDTIPALAWSTCSYRSGPGEERAASCAPTASQVECFRTGGAQLNMTQIFQTASRVAQHHST